MAKFFGAIGFGISKETAAGVWQDLVEEREYYGDVIEFVNRNASTNFVNPNLNLTNSISIVADPFAYHHHSKIKYVKWLGSTWNVSSIRVQGPRLILSFSEVYNGPTT